MKTKLLLFLVLCAFAAKAQTIEVSGLQSGSWNAETILVTGDVTIQDSLTIAAGTTVVFKGFYQIKTERNASLKAIGTENDSITFTVNDTTGFHIFNSGRGGWNGIRLNKAGASKFDYCRFQYGKAALDNDQDGGAMRIFHCDDVEISNSTLFCNFSREHGGALSAEWSNVVINDCDVCNNMTYTKLDTVYGMYGGGMRFLNCKVDIIGTNFSYNIGQGAIGGALSLDSCAVKIDRCKFKHNYGVNGGGLYLIRSNDWACSITNSLFANNISEHFGGGLAISDSSPLVCNLTVVNNHSIGVNCGGIFFYQYSSPIVMNCLIYGNTNEVLINKPVQLWIWTYDDEAPKFHNCLVQFGSENISGFDIINTYENCLDADPLFADPENEDFHLTANSPCIDAGHPAGIEGSDLDGNWRICGDNIDIGAYEFNITSISETSQNESLIRIVGNPVKTSSYAEIKCENMCNLVANVYSLDGKHHTVCDLGTSQVGLNRIEIGEMFQNMPNGIYLFSVKTTDKTLTAKIIKTTTGL